MLLTTAYERLTPHQQQQLNSICEQFEQALIQDSTLRAEDWSHDVVFSAETRKILLTELLILECEYRLRKDPSWDCQQVYTRFPDEPDLVRDAVIRATSYACAYTEHASPERDQALTSIGRFRILRELGRGGFGVVYLAHDPTLGRQVAVKVPHPQLAANPDIARRLAREAEYLARLDHPHLVPVYETGFAEGRFFLVSAYVQGSDLAEWIQESLAASGDIPWQQSVELLIQLAQAVEYVHGHGLLHCDIKPANILLDRAPQLTARLTDFGLSRVMTSAQPSSVSGDLVGTPQYMAPEQAAGKTRELSPRTDVYAMGAVMYELFTGRPPVPQDQMLAMLRYVMEHEPIRPRLLRPGLPGDLEAVCLKCLEKDAARRYPTVRALQEDLHRYLAGDPVHAQPPSRLRALATGMRKHPALTSVIMAVIIIVFGVLLGLFAHSARLNVVNKQLLSAQAEILHEQQVGRDHENALKLQAYPDQIRLAALALDRHDRQTALRILERIPEDTPDLHLRGWEWRYLRHLASMQTSRVLAEGSSAIHTLAIHPDKEHLAYSGEDGVVCVIAVADGKQVEDPWPMPEAVGQVVFAPDGKSLAVACDDGCVYVCHRPSRRCEQLGPFPGRPHAVAFHPSGEWLALGGDDPRIVMIDLTPAQRPDRTIGCFPWEVRTMTFSVDGNKLALGGREYACAVWDLEQDEVQYSFVPRSHINNVLFSATGRTVIAGLRNSGVQWHTLALPAETKQEAVPFEEWIPERVNDLSLSPDGRLLAVAGESGVTIFNWPEWTRSMSLPGHASRTYCARFVTNDVVISAGEDGIVRRHQLKGETVARVLPLNLSLRTVTYSQDANTLLSIDSVDPRLMSIRTAEHPLQVQHHPAIPEPLQSIHCRSAIRALGYSGMVYEGVPGDRLTWRPLQSFPLQKPLNTLSLMTAMSESGRHIVMVGPMGIDVLDVETGEYRHRSHGQGYVVNACAIYGDQYLATSGMDRKVRLWDLASCEELAELAGHTGTVMTLAFSQDGQWLFSGSWDRTVRQWSMKNRECVATYSGAGGPIHCLCVSPDDRTLVAAGEDGVVRFWHIPTRVPMFRLPTLGAIHSVTINRTGDRLAFSTLDLPHRRTCKLYVLDAPFGPPAEH